jgi:hypothetical protein
MKQYSFVTKWELRSPVNDVWDAIYNSLEWPKWWKGVKSVVEIEKEDANGLNGVKMYTWQSVLPYELTFTMKLTGKEYLKNLKGVAFGDLEGTGEWFFSTENGVTYVTYNWNIYTNKPWMNFFYFLLKPLFVYNHNKIMHWGAVGLAKKLAATLIKG